MLCKYLNKLDVIIEKQRTILHQNNQSTMGCCVNSKQRCQLPQSIMPKQKQIKIQHQACSQQKCQLNTNANTNTNGQLPQLVSDYPCYSSQLNKNSSTKFTRMETCSTVATYSTLSKMMLRSTMCENQKIVQERGSAQNSLIKMIKHMGLLQHRDFGQSIIIQSCTNKIYQVQCHEQYIWLFMYAMFGYPCDNVLLFPHKAVNLQPFVQKIIPTHNFLLISPKNNDKTANSSLFLKFLIQCQKCYKLSTITHSCAIFDLNYCNCQCITLKVDNSSKGIFAQDYVSVSVLKAEPSSIRMYSQNSTIIYGRNKRTKIKNATRCRGSATERTINSKRDLKYQYSLKQNAEEENSKYQTNQAKQTIICKKTDKIFVMGCKMCFTFQNISYNDQNACKIEPNNNRKLQKVARVEGQSNCCCVLCDKCRNRYLQSECCQFQQNQIFQYL